MDAQRRLISQLLLGSAFFPSLSACRSDKPLQVASHIWPGYEFMYLARNEGLLDTNKVRLQETKSASDNLQALHSGAVQAAALTLDELLMGRSQGLALSAVLVFNVSVGADQVIARPEIRRLEDIRGKRVGAETTALGMLMLSKTLAAAGMTKNQIELVLVDANDPNAWDTQQLDVMLTYEPTATRLLKSGAHSLYSSRDFPDTIFDVLAVRTDTIEPFRENLTHLLKGHFLGLQAFRENPVDTSYRLARRLQVDGQQVGGLYRGLQLPDLAANRNFLTAPAQRLNSAAKEINQILLQSGYLDRPVNLEQLATADYLPRSLS